MSKGLELYKGKILGMVEGTDENMSVDYNVDDMILTVSKRDGYISINGSELKRQQDADYTDWLDDLAGKAYIEMVQRSIDRALIDGYSHISLPLLEKEGAVLIGIQDVSLVRNDTKLLSINQIEFPAELDKTLEVIEFVINEDTLKAFTTFKYKRYSEKTHEEKLLDLLFFSDKVLIPFITERRVLKDTTHEEDIIVIDGREFKRKNLMVLLRESIIPFELTEDRKKYLDESHNHVNEKGEKVALTRHFHSDKLKELRGMFGSRTVLNEERNAVIK